MAQITIDNILDIACRKCHKSEINIKVKLERALSLAISLNDISRIEAVRDAIIAYEDSVANDDWLGLWGFSYDLLWNNEKVSLTDDQKRKIIQNLETRLVRVSCPVKTENLNPWAAKEAALRLAKHYKNIGKNEDVKRVLNQFEHSLDTLININNIALRAYCWLEEVYMIYSEFGHKDEAEKLTIRLRDLGKQIPSEMKTISCSMKISFEKMEQYVSELIAGNLEEVLSRISYHYIPSKSEIENQLKDLAEKAPLQFLIRSEIHDYQGRHISSIGSIEDDLNGHIVNQISQDIRISSPFLREVIKAVIDKFNISAKALVEYIYKAPVFDENKRTIIETGIQEYLNGNYIIAIHLLIPQIEDAFRKIIEKSGGSVLKPSRSDGFDLKVLDKILRDAIIVKVFTEDAALYFRVLLTEPRGWNIRNNVCHGLYPSEAFNAIIADRIFHVLLCLAQIREKPV
jgi:hypothetical protein